MFEEINIRRQAVAQHIADAFEKARYVDNAENRRRGRVGQSYGVEKRENDSSKSRMLSVKKLTPESAEYAAKVEQTVRGFMSGFKKDATEKEIKDAVDKIISSSKKENSVYSRREIQEKLYFN